MKPGWRECVMVVVTFARLLLVWGLANSLDGSKVVSIVWVIAIVVVDIYDGAIARRFAADGLSRRVADVTVDYITVVIALYAIRQAHPQYVTPTLLFIFGLVACYKLLYFYAGIMSFFRYRVLLRGKGWHKVYPLSLAAIGCMMILEIQPTSIYILMGGVVLVLGINSAMDSYMTYRRIVRQNYQGNETLVIMPIYAGWPQSQERNSA